MMNVHGNIEINDTKMFGESVSNMYEVIDSYCDKTLVHDIHFWSKENPPVDVEYDSEH